MVIACRLLDLWVAGSNLGGATFLTRSLISLIITLSKIFTYLGQLQLFMIISG